MHRFFTLLLTAATLLAHHSIDAEFDRTKEIDYKATVTRTEWVNPHMLFYANVTGQDGKAVEWKFELSSLNHLIAEGWKKTTIQTGQVLTIRAFPAKDGSPKATPVKITWPDGTTRENKGAWADWMSVPNNSKIIVPGVK